MKNILNNFLKKFNKDNLLKIFIARGNDKNQSKNKLDDIESNIVNLKHKRKLLIDLFSKKKINGLTLFDRDCLKKLKEEINLLEEKLFKSLCEVPNEIVDPCSENKIIFETNFNCLKGKTHYDITNCYNLSDSAKISSDLGFTYLEEILASVYRNIGFLFVNYAVLHGFKEMYVPHLLKEISFIGGGHIPYFRDIIFKVENRDLYLIPTSEIAILSSFINKVIPINKLPIRMCSFSTCYRDEIGSSCKINKGLFRLRQFDKLEMFSICKPNDFQNEFDFMLSHVKKLLNLLELDFRIIQLPANDLGFTSCKTYDVEIWLPVSQQFVEVSSISLCKNFQSIRTNIKMSDKNFPYTLNGTAFAVGRILLGLLEKFQDINILNNKIKKMIVDFII